MLFLNAIDFGIISPKKSVIMSGMPTFSNHPGTLLKIFDATFCIKMFTRMLSIRMVTMRSRGRRTREAIRFLVLSVLCWYERIFRDDKEKSAVSDPESNAEHSANNTRAVISKEMVIGFLCLVL